MSLKYGILQQDLHHTLFTKYTKAAQNGAQSQ